MVLPGARRSCFLQLLCFFFFPSNHVLSCGLRRSVAAQSAIVPSLTMAVSSHTTIGLLDSIKVPFIPVTFHPTSVYLRFCLLSEAPYIAYLFLSRPNPCIILLLDTTSTVYGVWCRQSLMRKVIVSVLHDESFAGITNKAPNLPPYHPHKSSWDVGPRKYAVS